MKIGIDCRLWDETGVGRYIRNLVKELQVLDKKNNYTLFVLGKDYEKFKVQSPIQSGTKFKVRIADIRWHTIEEQLRFPSIINRENLDLMHFTYYSVPIFYKRPFVATIHDLILHHFPTGEASTLPLPLYNLKLLGYKFVIAQAAKKAKKIITVSKATKDEIIDHLKVDHNKIIITHEGVDGEITNPKSQIPNKSSAFAKASADKQNTKYPILNTKYFLYVGNAYPHKNLEILIKAFDLLCHPERSEGSSLKQDSSQASPDQNDMKLVLVGREDYFYKRLKEKVKDMGLERLILFYGKATDGELSALYKNALALVIPSLMEGFGLPALEAMANKCLVLASDTRSLREICGNAALYFSPLSVDELVKKLNMITLHTTVYGELEKLRRRGAERAKMFSWEKMARETLSIYESCFSL